MPAHVVINLDTAAPVVTFGAVVRPTATRVELPYVVSPDTQELSASCEDQSGADLPVLDEGAKFVIDSIPDSSLLLTLTIQAEDDVGNVSITTRQITISIFELRAKLKVVPALTSRVTITKVMALRGRVGKALRGFLKIDQGDR